MMLRKEQEMKTKTNKQGKDKGDKQTSNAKQTERGINKQQA